MNIHRQKQIEAISQIENQIRNDDLNFSTVTHTKSYESDPRICLTSVHFPSNLLKKKIEKLIIEPLRQISPGVYFYSRESMHMTIKNIRVINNPPRFTTYDIKKATKIFSQIIPKHRAFRVYFYKLLLFPNNLALIGTTDPELDAIILDLDRRLISEGLPDDKQYTNSQYFFSNMTLARFSSVPEEFINKVKDLSNQIKLDPYVIDSVSLITGNAILKHLKIIGEWRLARDLGHRT